MQHLLKELINQAYLQVEQQYNILIDKEKDIEIERCKDPKHGDFATNFAMVQSKSINTSPRQLAEWLVAALPETPLLDKAEVAGPGFINFSLAQSTYHQNLRQILQNKHHFGRHLINQGQKIHLEFVSANPTGPLHVGHGRSAAYASCVGNLLEAVGYKVHREYYVNDAGRQMRILALSTWLRYLELFDETISFPENAYQGNYIIDIAKEVQQAEGKHYYCDQQTFSGTLLTLKKDTDNKETLIDAYIMAAQQILGEKNFSHIQTVTLETILNEIHQDLTEFGVEFDQWFYESELLSLGLIKAGIDLLKDHGFVYERDGAIWFNAIHFGDEKDRVLVRENGQPTYFASDVAYHLYKYNQKFDQMIDVFGADHHGYIARIRAFLQGLNKDPNKLQILLVQFVSLFRGEQKISMSTRSGSFITLRELREEVGNDATRFFYIFRKPEQHLDFDLELAKKQSNDNPVYYIQYAYARIESIWRQFKTTPWSWEENQNDCDLNVLGNAHEKEILRQLAIYPEIIQLAAREYAPHLLAHYLHKLAHLFHSYYNNERFLIEDEALRNARLNLISGIQQVIANGLNLLGISAPSRM